MYNSANHSPIPTLTLEIQALPLVSLMPSCPIIGDSQYAPKTTPLVKPRLSLSGLEELSKAKSCVVVPFSLPFCISSYSISH